MVDNMKITINNNSATVTIDKNKSAQSSGGAKNSLSKEDIAIEKARLQKLALEYENRIKELRKQKSGSEKNKAVQSNATQSDKTSLSNSVVSEMNKQVLKQEKIELGTDSIDLTADLEKPKRRRSLMEINPSTRPDLQLKVGYNRSSSQEEKNIKVNVGALVGKDLLNVIRMQVSDFFSPRRFHPSRAISPQPLDQIG